MVEGADMRLALLTISAGDCFEKMAAITHPTLKAYADKCGADFIVWKHKPSHYSHAGFMKFDIGDLFKTYDRVLFVDTDILIRDDAPDLFKKIPENAFAAFNEGQYMDRRPAMAQFLREKGLNNEEIDKAWLSCGKYFNTGVMMIPRALANYFVQPIRRIENFYEQTQLNYVLFTAMKNRPEIPFIELHYKFNRMSHMDKPTGEGRWDSYFLHYAGAVGLDGKRESIIKTMEMDLKIWNTQPRKYKRNVFVVAGGGIGDVIASEPVVRFMWEEMYPESNFVLQTPFPEVFEHLKETGMQVMKSGTKIPDVGFYECYLMPEPEKIVNAFITHSLCHPTDYASIMALKGQIPIALRTPKLKTKTLSNEIEDRLKQSVLIHPGKGWKSKTFPANFWAETCKSISEAGYHVAIIGKTVNETQGVVEFDHGDALNLIDKLDLLETFRAIELAPVLISNDSMPIHAAGAFDNWIGLIASCKHPDRILPYRKGYQRYKASALNVGLIYREYRPTHQIEVKMDDAEDWEIEKCLPKPEQIIQWLEKIPSGLKKIKT